MVIVGREPFWGLDRLVHAAQAYGQDGDEQSPDGLGSLSSIDSDHAGVVADADATHDPTGRELPGTTHLLATATPHHRSPADLGMEFTDDVLITEDGVALHLGDSPPTVILEGSGSSGTVWA
jgi:hypothetical protein